MLSAGLLNTYMAGYLFDLNHKGLNSVMWQEALDDAVEASKAGVDTDKDLRLFFYIDHFAEDLADELYGNKLNDEQHASLKNFMFDQRFKFSYNNLIDFREAASEWLAQMGLDKKAHKNTGFNYKTLPRYNMVKWQELIDRIKQSVNMGFGLKSAMNEAAAELDIPERYDFLQWCRNYTDTVSKYDVGNEIKAKSKQAGIMDTLIKVADMADERYYYVPRMRNPIIDIEKPEAKEKELPKPLPQASERMALDFEAARNKLMGRVFAIDKLLEKYKKVLTSDAIEGIEDALNDLRKKIRKLKQAASIKDTIVKSAGILAKYSFAAGSEQLLALAAEPFEGHAVADAGRDNDINKILEKLENTSHMLKARELVREIGEIDLMLAAINMGSFFPELQDAQAKLIDALGYASNKVDAILPKLRGGLAAAEQIGEQKQQKTDIVDELRNLSENIARQPEPVVPDENTLKALEFPADRRKLK